MNKRKLPVDYVRENGNVSFSLKPFCEADTAPFSMFLLMDINNVGIPFEGQRKFITYHDAVNNQIALHGDKKYGLLLPLDINELLIASSESNRYGEVRFYNLFNKVSDATQSTFVMADITNEITLVIFGGTDDTIVGWQEDLDLLISHNVECLNNAKEYVERNCTNKHKKYIFIGHSKGGMVATHCMFCVNENIKKNILAIYDLDGPGFQEDYLRERLDDQIIERLNLICPKESFVGRLFFQPKPAIVVRSKTKGLMQHNTTSWLIEDDHYARCGKFSKRATVKSVMAYEFMNNLTEEDKVNFVNGLTKIAHAGNSKTLSKLILHPFAIFKTAVHLPKAERKQVFSLPFKLLFSKIVARRKVEERKKNAK